MTDEVPEDSGEAAARPSIMRRYRKYAPPSSLTREQCRRQTDVLRAVCEHLAPRGASIAFLNAYDKTLGGIPLQLALESDEGLLRVEQHLASLGDRNRPGSAAAEGTRS